MDDKGRLTLPAKFREQLAGGVMVTRGLDRCLSVYLPADFNEVALKATSSTSKVDEGARSYLRLLFSGTEELVPDAQGRISLGPKLREYAGLSKTCVVNGVVDHLEIWDEQMWEQYNRAHEESFSRGTNPALGAIL
ncbi:division/cell wall cluster transcriptional repressor MraZ [Williamsia sp. CHRR-6]|nr:division/cell wall cluster transcriptional repressor MraZ [Williamsia sp. CHRR-6]